jgi:hypothetical protein
MHEYSVTNGARNNAEKQRANKSEVEKQWPEYRHRIRRGTVADSHWRDLLREPCPLGKMQGPEHATEKVDTKLRIAHEAISRPHGKRRQVTSKPSPQVVKRVSDSGEAEILAPRGLDYDYPNQEANCRGDPIEVRPSGNPEAFANVTNP